MIFIKILIEECSLLFVVLIVNGNQFVCRTENWIFICECTFGFEVAFLDAVIVIESRSNILDFYILIVNADWFCFESLNFLVSMTFIMIRMLIFELYPKTIDEAKIKRLFLDFGRNWTTLSEYKEFFVINFCFLFFVGFVVLFVWFHLIFMMRKYLVYDILGYFIRKLFGTQAFLLYILSDWFKVFWNRGLTILNFKSIFLCVCQ